MEEDMGNSPPKLGDIVLYKPDLDSFADEKELWPAIIINVRKDPANETTVDLTAFRTVGGTTVRTFVKEGSAPGQWRRH